MSVFDGIFEESLITYRLFQTASKTSRRPSLERMIITVHELMKSWPKRMFRDEKLDIDDHNF